MKGLLLINLGSPKSPAVEDVREYLDEFLNDPYVIDIAPLARKLLVNGIILNTRPKKSAHAYSQIWTEQGSPLMVHTQNLTTEVRKIFDGPVEFGMRYGCPCIESAFLRLKAAGVREFTVIPLYPQYSYAASETAIVEIENIFQKHGSPGSLKIIEYFHHEEKFLDALANSMRSTWESEKADALLLTYHGIPERQLTKTRNQTNYRDQCFETSEGIRKRLGLREDQVITTFQSRLGRTPWIKPYTDLVLPELPKKGIKKLVVASPSFTADCLETLEEIKMQYADLFKEHGGESFTYVPCLNSSREFAEFIARS